MSEGKKKELKGKKPPKPTWWKPYSIVMLILTVLVVVIPLIFYIILGYSLWEYLVYALVIVITMGVIYYVRFQTSKTINMGIYILVGAVCLFLVAVFTTTFFIVLTKAPTPANFIGDKCVFILYFIIIPSLGGITGYLLGKKRDYKIPIGVNYYEKKGKYA